MIIGSVGTGTEAPSRRIGFNNDLGREPRRPRNNLDLPNAGSGASRAALLRLAGPICSDFIACVEPDDIAQKVYRAEQGRDANDKDQQCAEIANTLPET